MQERRITITESEYIMLLERSNLLLALQNCGVEDWDGFSEARMSLLEREEESKQLNLTEQNAHNRGE